MRRMIKEDLLTFDGKRLFPERKAETVPYELTELEYDLYEQVTDYVREGMNRADRVGGKRKNTVGFALTVLQRRLASSPKRSTKAWCGAANACNAKSKRSSTAPTATPNPTVDLEGLDADDYNAEEVEDSSKKNSSTPPPPHRPSRNSTPNC